MNPKGGDRTEAAPYSALNRILSVTKALVLQHGCKKTTLKEIIANSGISNGGVYHYVKSKDDIYGLILRKRLEQINERFYREAEMNLVGPVSIIVSELFGDTDDCRVFRSVYLYLVSQPENERIRPIIRSFYDYWLKLGSDWLKLGQQDGVIHPDLDPHQMSSYILSYYIGLLVNSAYVTDEAIFRQEPIVAFVAKLLQP